MFLKNGLKSKIINLFYFYINIILIKFIKFNKKLVVNIYFNQIIKKILPIFNYNIFFKKNEKIFVPRIIFNKKLNFKKLNSISCSWIKKSVHARKEKTTFLKIVSELESIRSNSNCNSISLKKDYYTSFYNNKYYLKFLKKKKWI